jgi:hypothetical protein
MTNGAIIHVKKKEGSIGDTTKRFLFVRGMATIVTATTASRRWMVFLFQFEIRKASLVILLRKAPFVILSRQPLLVIILIINTLSILQGVNNQFHVQKRAPKKEKVSPREKKKLDRLLCVRVFST